MHTRWSPSRTYSCTLSSVASRSSSSAPIAAVAERDRLGRGPPQRHEAHAEGEAAVVVAAHQPVDLEGHGEAVGRGPGQPGGLDQLGQRQRPVLDGHQDRDRLVEDADTAYRRFHTTRLASQIMRLSKSGRATAHPRRGMHHGDAPHAEREDLGRPRRPFRRRRARPPLHRPAPRARGHVAPGVRRPAHERSHRPPARPHRRHRGPQRPDRRTSTCPSPIRSRASRSTRCATTAPSSASASTRWATRARASCTSSARSRA